MNEEALQQLYSLAQNEGYKKSIEDFKILMSSNEGALSNMYNVAQNEGYNKPIEDFKVLVGFGGASTQETDPPVKKKGGMVSSSADGSSESQEVSYVSPEEFDKKTLYGESVDNATYVSPEKFDATSRGSAQDDFVRTIDANGGFKSREEVAQDDFVRAVDTDGGFKPREELKFLTGEEADKRLDETLATAEWNQPKEAKEEIKYDPITKEQAAAADVATFPEYSQFEQADVTRLDMPIGEAQAEQVKETIDAIKESQVPTGEESVFILEQERLKSEKESREREELKRKKEQNLYSNAELEAIKFFKERGRDYEKDKALYDEYNEVRDALIFLEDESKYQEKDLTPEQRAEFGSAFYYNGVLRTDIVSLERELNKRRDELASAYLDDEAQQVREDFDQSVMVANKERIDNAVLVNNQAVANINKFNDKSIQKYGVSAEKLNTLKPQTIQEANEINLFIDDYNKAKLESQLAANQYEDASLYLETQFDKDNTLEFVDNFSAIKSQAKEGLSRGNAGDIILQYSMGITPDNEASTKEAAEKIVAALMQKPENKSRVMSRWEKANGFDEGFDVIADDPIEWAVSLAASSMSQMLPYGSKIVAATTATGAGAGAAAAGLAGAATGAVYGLRAGMATTMFAMEYTNEVMDAISHFGYDISDPDSVAEALQDNEVWARGRERGLKRGIPIAIVDYLTASLAGKVIKVGSVASKAKRIGAMTAERLLVDPLGEASGEAIAQVTVGDELDFKEIVAEAGGGLGNNTSNMAINLARETKSKNRVDLANKFTDINFISKEISSDKQISDWSNNMERLGKITPEVNQRIQKNVGLRRDAKDLQDAAPIERIIYSGKNRAVRARIMTLLAAKEELSSTQNRRSVFGEKIREIDAELASTVETGNLLPQEEQVVLAGQGVLSTTEQASATDVREALPEYRIKKGIRGKMVPVSKEEFLKRIDESSADELQKINATVTNDAEVVGILEEKLKEVKEDAIQEPSTETVDAQEPAESSPTMGETVPGTGTITEPTEVEADKTEQEVEEKVADIERRREEELNLEKPFKQKNDGSGLVEIKTTVTEEDGIKKTTFKTKTTNRKGESREQADKNYNTIDELFEDLGFEETYEGEEEELRDLATLQKGRIAVKEVREINSVAAAAIVIGGDILDIKLHKRNKDNAKYDAEIAQVKAAQQVEEEATTEQEVEADEQEVADLRALISEPTPKVDFRLKSKEDIDTEVGPSADLTQDITRQINELPSGNVATKIEIEEGVDIDVDELNNRTDTPIKRVSLEIINGIPTIFTISDQLTTGDIVNPKTGNSIINLKGGLGFTGTEGNENAAWANTSEAEARDLLNKAEKVYQDNVDLFNKFWEDNPEYNGLVPMNVVKMGEGSLLSNEATFRVLSDNMSIVPDENKINAINILRDTINIDTKNKKETISEGGLTKNTSKSYQKAIDANDKIISMLEGMESIESLITEDKIKQLSLPQRRILLEKIAYGKANRAGEKVSPGDPKEGSVADALIKGMPIESKELFHIGTITDLITDNQMANIPQRSIVAIQGVDVLNPDVIETNHPNYPFGVKGKSIGILEKSAPIQDVYPTAFNNAIIGLTKAEAKKKTFTEKQVEKSQKRKDESERLKPGQLKPSSLGTILTETIGVQNGLPGLEFIGAISEGNISNINKLISFINTAFPSVNISTDPNTFNNVLQSDGVKVYLKGNEIVYGVTVDGDIYINPDVHNSESAMFNTAIHEMGHIWTDYLRTNKKGREIYNKGAELVKQTDTFKQQLALFNGDVDKATNEAMAILIGNKGETIADSALKSKFTEWLLGVWKYIKSQFKMSKNLSAEEIQNLTLDEFLGSALADIFSGKEIKISDAQMKKLKNPDAAFSKNISMQSIIEIGRNNALSNESIKVVLKERGFKDSDINKALKVDIDLFTAMPKEFGNVEGGVEVGLKLFNETTEKTNKFSTEGPRGGVGTTRTKSFAEIREKAQEILKSNPIYKVQPEQVQLELQVALDRVLGIKKGPNVSRQIADIRNTLKQRKIGADTITDAQRSLRMFIRKVMPKSKNYSNTALNKLIKAVNNTTPKNFDGQVQVVLNELEKQRQVLKNEVIDKIIKIARDKSKTARTSANRKRSKGLDAIGQSYFKEAKRVLDLVKNQDFEGLAAMQAEINEELITAALDNIEEGKTLTAKERALIDKQIALDTFADVMTMSLEEVNQLFEEVKTIRAESIARLNNRREARRIAVNNIKEKFNEQISEDFEELYNEEGEQLGKNILRNKREGIYKSFQAKGIWNKVTAFTDKFRKNGKYDANGIIKFFRGSLQHLGTTTNILDRGKEGMFTKIFYNQLNDMDEKNLAGVFEQLDVMDSISNSEAGKVWGKWKYTLGTDVLILDGIKESKTGKTYREGLNRDQAMRLYALSLNPVQREKLQKQGFTEEKMKLIEDFIKPEGIGIANQIVDYFSNKYFNEVNNIYVQANDVNLGYVENYFPTRTISAQKKAADMISGDFSKVFTADTSPALQERTDTTGDVEIGMSFTDVVEQHIKDMERYKAYALGVKQMNEVYKSPDIQTLLQETGLFSIFSQNLNYAINPDAGPKTTSGVLSWIQRKFTGFALAFKPIQVLKQTTSFVQAYEDYSFVKGKPIPGFDMVMFALDYAKVLSNLPKNIKESKEISATFKNRMKMGMEGDVFGLESGGRTYKKIGSQQGRRGAAVRGFKKAAGIFTVMGDILGVLGYKAVYNRNIANGMSKAEALSAFNNYNATQQTRRSTEKVALQQDNSFASKYFTMFGSTLFLQMNKTFQSANNIVKNFKPTKGEFGSLKDYRALALNVSVANALFTAAAYSGALLKGDDEDKDRAWQAIKDAALGLNILYQIPLAGTAIEEAVSKARGKRAFTSEGVNPFTSVSRKVQKSYKLLKDDEVIKAVKPIIELSIGAQFDSPIGIYNLIGGSGEDEDFYDALGITPSYRPGYGKRKSKKESSKSQSKLKKSEVKEFFPDLYKELYEND